MKNLEKIGYILIGAGLGGLIATAIYERELNKPVGEVEEYIPKEYGDSNISEDGVGVGVKVEEDTEFSDSYTVLSNIYSSSSSDPEKARREEFDRRRAQGRNQKTLYHKMYKSASDETEIEDIYADIKEFADDDEIEHGGDIPNDDEPYEEDVESLDNELVRERVENNFEIYLGENPQDFITLIFYQGDTTMTDDQEQLVPNPEDVVGNVAISRLIEGGPGAEEGVIYVRNLKTMINYEIVLDAGSYRDTVLGIFNSRRNNGADGSGNT